MRTFLWCVLINLLALAAGVIGADRELYVGAFYQYSDRYGDNPALVSNVTVVVEPNVAKRLIRTPVIIAPELEDEARTPVRALWVSGITVADVDAQAASLQNSGRHTPILGYVDSGSWTWCPTRPDWIGVQAYRMLGESLTAFDARVRRMINACPGKRIALIVQAYDTNDSLATDVSPQFQYYLAWTQQYPQVIAVLAFSDGRSFVDGSKGGLRVHPQWAGQYDTMAQLLLGPRPAAPQNLRVLLQ